MRFAQRAALLAAGAAVTGCVSSTIIRSDPPGAIVREDGLALGRTPIRLETDKASMTMVAFTIEKDGYLPAPLVIQRNRWDVAQIVVGSLLCPPSVWWAAYFEPEYTVKLVPMATMVYDTSDVPNHGGVEPGPEPR